MTEQAATLLILLGVVNMLAVLGLWLYVARHSGHLDAIDRRVVALEERISGMPAVRTQLDSLSSQVAGLRERSDHTLQLIRSLQEYLMEHKP